MEARLLMWWRFKYFLVLLLGIITLIAFGLRIININQVPSGLTWDEASLGYNAYSILKTGRDEYGNFMPLVFKSFGDYKPGLYVYLDIPFIAVFGLNELSTRMPSILLGAFVPLLGYFLILEIFGKRYKGAAFLSAFLLAISPWAVHFSRGAWEANVALFETLLALLLFLKSRLGNRPLFILSIILFGTTIYTYQSAKLFSTLLLIGLVFLYKRTFLKKNFQAFTWALIISFVIILLLSLASADARSRLAVLNQYSYKRSDQALSLIRQQEIKGDNLSFNLFHFENLEYIKTVSSRYLGYFSPKFLFLNGALNGREGMTDYGVMQLFEVPLFFTGIYFLLRLNSENKKVLYLWLVLSPISAALSRDILNTVRALPEVFGLEVISGLGAYFIIRKILNLKRLFAVFGLGILLVGCLFFFGFYLDKYFIHYKYHSSQYWLYGYKQAVDFVEQNKNQYTYVVFTTKLNEPYIFYLFYTKYDPQKYQAQAKLVQNGLDVGEVPAIDNIKFRPLYWPHDRFVKNILYVGGWLEIPDQDIDHQQSQILKIIKYYDGAIAFKIAATKK